LRLAHVFALRRQPFGILSCDVLDAPILGVAKLLEASLFVLSGLRLALGF
jgi:hypothetical protein